jgi:hypothetical protein
MVRKIKVVEVEHVETPEQHLTKSNVLESKPNVLIEPLPTPEPPTPEPTEPQTPKETVEEQLSTIEPEKEEVEPPKESKPKKLEEKITCSICNKSMLMKTYRYTHQKLCKLKEPEPVKVVEEKPKVKKQMKPKETESQPANLGQVSFSEYKETHRVIPDPLEIYRVAKEHRQQIRIQRVKSLISQAI